MFNLNVIAQHKIEQKLFDGCLVDSSVVYTKKSHELFQINLPEIWSVDNELPQGVDISSNNFPDSNQRGFMLSVLPYADFYYDKNPRIDYYKYEFGTFKGRKAKFYVRNDLGKRDNDTVYWRAEIKVLNKKEDLIYYLILGKRADKVQEPDWCDFQEIIESFKLID